MKTLPEMFAAVARQHAGRTALVERGVALSYSALQEKVISLAAALHARGVRRGHSVALLLPNSVDFVTGYFSIVTLGAIVVPVNDQYQHTELLHVIKECGVSGFVTSRALAPLCHQVLRMNASSGPILVIEGHAEAARSTLTPSPGAFDAGVDPDAPVMYQFSSGSTGRAKRIARTHANLLFELSSFARTLNISSADRFLGVAPFSHVNGLMRSMLASIHAGATLYPVARFERQAVADIVEQERISVFIAVPFMFAMLARANFRTRPDFSSLRLCVSASAPLPKAISAEFHRKFALYVRQLYGSTETGTISVNVGADVARTLESVGTPLPGVEVEVYMDDGRIAETGEVGELAIKSPAAIRAYVGLAELNKDVFRNAYFFTGDLGRRDANGLLYLVGRKTSFINRGGYKIDPREVEEVLESHPQVAEAVVIGLPTPYGDEKIKAVIVCKTPCTEEDVLEYCQGKIATFKIPSVIEIRDTLPKGPTGKVRRDTLR